MSSTPDTTTTARETAKNTPLENAKTLRSIYNKGYEFPNWVLDEDRWKEDQDKSHKFDDTIVVYDDDDDIKKVKELVEKREPVNIEMNLDKEKYKKDQLETNFGWEVGAYSKSTNSKLYPNIGIYCHARVTNGIEPSKPGAKEKNVHVMNLIGYGFDNTEQPDYQYFLNTYGLGKSDLKNLDSDPKQKFKEDLIQRYRKIWLKACYICELKGLKNLWYYGVGSGFFSKLLPIEYNKDSGKFYNEIFAPAFGINPNDSTNLHSSNTDQTDLTIPINFCKRYGIEVINLGPSSDKFIPDVLFTADTTPADTLYINAWDPWSIIGNGNAGDISLDGHWGRNSNMSVLGWSMTNSKLLPDIVGGDGAETSKILKMSDILAKIQAKDGSKGASSTASGDPPSGKVAQFFMTFKNKDGSNGGLSGYDQCRKIVNAVKCLMAKGYKHIGLTYSANQKQTIQIWKEYNYPEATDFDDGKEKTILQTGIDGTGQAQTIGIHNKQERNEEGKFVDKKPVTSTTHIDDLTSNLSDENSNFKKAFRIIPFSTMKTGGGTTEVALGSPGDINECIKAATEFLQLEKSIILGWCNQEIETLTDLNKDSFNKDYTPDDASKFPFAIGGGVGGKSKLPFLFSTYLKEYFKFLTSNWSEEVQKIVTDCSPNPKSADSTASSTSSPSKIETSKPLDHVIKDLIAGIKNTEDNEATLSALKIQEPSGGLVYKYPPSDASPPSSATPTPPSSSSASPPPTPPPVTEYKNLNSADPAIDVMITDFESAIDEDDKNFYLGACRSIKAAYDLDMSLAGTDNDKKIRAKLLLNLRKNSLLLKLPAHWDYKEMKMGVEVEPELTEKEVKAKYDILQQECAGLKGGYQSEEAYKLAEQLIPLDEKIQNDKLEKQNTLVSEIYPDIEYKYIPVEIKKLETKTEYGNLQFKRIQGQSSSNCGRAALLNFFGTENLLIKGDPSKSDITFDLKKARPDTKIDMSSICHLYSKCAKLFNDRYNDEDDGCPDNENYSISVLGYTLQILGYNYNQHIHFKKGIAEEYDKLNNSVKDNKILGYLVSFSKVHWLCYQRENLNTDNDSFYGINSTYEENETTAKALRLLVDEHRRGREYLSLYPIFREESSNQKICSLLTLADTKDKYKNQITQNETTYKWNVLMKEVTSNIQSDNDFKTDEEKLKVMFYLSSLPGGVIDVNLKKQILNSSDQIKSKITQIFVDDTKENIKKIQNSNSSVENKLEIVKQNKDYLELVGKSTGGFYYAPNFQAKYRFYYNLNNTNEYNKNNVDKLKTTIKYNDLIEALKKKIDHVLTSSSSTESPGGGGFKPSHNAITTHYKSKHNSSFKVSSSSKSKTKTKNHSHTQRVK
jgi:hypothetical protein